jgi:predicted transposase/invertase (TIGR01784 family)
MVPDKAGELLNPGLDFVFKKIFGDVQNADMTGDFLASALKLPAEELNTLTFINTELFREHANDKKGILDVRIKTPAGMEINIEMQNFYEKTMAERAIFYWAKMFTSHLSKGQTYEQLTKTIHIGILHFNFFPYKKYHSVFTPREETENYLLSDLFRIDFLEIPKAKDIPVKHDDKLAQWLKFFSTKEKEALKMLAKKNPMIEKAVGILEVLSGDEKIRMEAFYREREIRDEISRITSARNEGKAEGRNEKGIEIAKKLLTTNLSVGQISEATGLSIKEIQKLKNTNF